MRISYGNSFRFTGIIGRFASYNEEQNNNWDYFFHLINSLEAKDKKNTRLEDIFNLTLGSCPYSFLFTGIIA